VELVPDSNAQPAAVINLRLEVVLIVIPTVKRSKMFTMCDAQPAHGNLLRRRMRHGLNVHVANISNCLRIA